jgi:hypothetical protein
LRAIAAVAVDLAPHLVVGRLCGSHKDDAAGLLAKLLRVVALAAAYTAKHECHRIPAIWLHTSPLAQGKALARSGIDQKRQRPC